MSILPVTASHQTANSQGDPQGALSLGGVFQVLLQEATIRLDARPADLAAFEARRPNREPGYRPSATATISSVDTEDRRENRDFQTQTPRDDATEIPERRERVARDDAPIYRDSNYHDDAIETVARPDHDTPAPEAVKKASDTPESIDSDIPPTTGEVDEALDPVIPATSGEDDTDPVEIAAAIGLPLQAQPLAAPAAQTHAQALGAGMAPLDARAQATAPTQLPANAAQPAQAASNIIPAAATGFSAIGGASRVQVTPAALVAQPSAALGGGAAAAALAAEAAQNATPNAAANAAQNAQVSQPGAIAASQAVANTSTATQQLSRPGARVGQGETPANGLTQTAANQAGSQSAATPQNPVTVSVPTPAPSFTAQGITNPAAGEKGNPNPQNAQTPFAVSNNAQAANSDRAGGLTPNGHAAENGAQNGLAQNAQTQNTQAQNTRAQNTRAQNTQAQNTQAQNTQAQNAQAQNTQAQNARSLNAPAAAGDGAASDENDGPATVARTPSEPAQGARSTASAGTPNTAAQANHANAATPSGAAAQANSQNTQPNSATAMERAAASATFQRAEGSSQPVTSPAGTGTFGLNQAASHTPQMLPAQARPAAAPSLPANQVAVHIQRAVSAGQDRIRITLHPAELGQIDVKLNIGNDGAVKAVITIERPETFELLQRDARGLEKALQDAGLKTDSGSLSFNLKGEEEQNTAARRENEETGSQGAGTDTPDASELEPDIIAAANAGGAEHVLDLHV